MVQWAGVYPLDKNWAINHAAAGWAGAEYHGARSAHRSAEGILRRSSQERLEKLYGHWQRRSREELLPPHVPGRYPGGQLSAQRPDWDGKTLVVTGTSQGGLQSFVTAALDPKITAMMVMVPAGCDDTGKLAGRQPGWPNWLKDPAAPEEKQALETSRYFDAVNFAARVKCPALVGLGLIDVTAPTVGCLCRHQPASRSQGSRRHAHQRASRPQQFTRTVSCP